VLLDLQHNFPGLLLFLQLAYRNIDITHGNADINHKNINIDIDITHRNFGIAFFLIFKMPPKRSTRLTLPRGKRVRYTQLGPIPSNSAAASEHSALEHTEGEGQGNVVHKRKGRGPGKVLDVRPPEQRPDVWPVGIDEFTTETTKESNPR
jgi:hypothetical protein